MNRYLQVYDESQSRFYFEFNDDHFTQIQEDNYLAHGFTRMLSKEDLAKLRTFYQNKCESLLGSGSEQIRISL